jgi:c-di-GMP-binding flagellar brake protein YcgR
MTTITPDFYLLQNLGYFKEDSPRDVMIVGIAAGAIVVIAVIVHLVRGISGSSAKTTGSGSRSRSTSSSPGIFSAFAYRRIASSCNLDKEQSRLLENIFRSNSVADPDKAIREPALLDKYFRQAYKAIERNADTDEEAQQRLARLFSLRNAVDTFPDSSGGITSTTKVAQNVPAVLSTGKDSFTVRVISSRGDTLVVETPKNALGSPVRISKGTGITLSFFSKSSKGFSFGSRVLGNIDTPNGHGLELAHSQKPKALAQRRYRRKQASINCILYFVFLDNAKSMRKKPQKLIVDKRRFSGTVLDISAGGCSIKTAAPVQVGSRLKIEVKNSDDLLIVVLGQVLRTNRSGTLGTVVHIKFLKVPRRSFNSINTYVFGFDE